MDCLLGETLKNCRFYVTIIMMTQKMVFIAVCISRLVQPAIVLEGSNGDAENDRNVLDGSKMFIVL